MNSKIVIIRFTKKEMVCYIEILVVCFITFMRKLLIHKFDYFNFNIFVSKTIYIEAWAATGCPCGAALDAVPNLMVEYINKGFFLLKSFDLHVALLYILSHSIHKDFNSCNDFFFDVEYIVLYNCF